jgi:hypothetical protein
LKAKNHHGPIKLQSGISMKVPGLFVKTCISHYLFSGFTIWLDQFCVSNLDVLPEVCCVFDRILAGFGKDKSTIIELVDKLLLEKGIEVEVFV